MKYFLVEAVTKDIIDRWREAHTVFPQLLSPHNLQRRVDSKLSKAFKAELKKKIGKEGLRELLDEADKLYNVLPCK